MIDVSEVFLSCCHVSFHNLKKRLTDSFLMENGFGVTGKKKKTTTKDHVIYLKPQNTSFDFTLTTLLLDAIEFRLLSPKKEETPSGPRQKQLQKKELLLIVCMFDFVGKFLASLSLKLSNGFSYLLSNQKLAPASPSILEHASIPL